ncbi:DUF4333 domain-containing protein [Actinacidiphila soli]|uniref:DUF4333 domain-containing protein n=1 Tax=Actinacidiphila soli TaxID=2487275 RepID=UPI002247BE13|nr:DUF4333 domain-containing protein [Actinacidiphila soli]
MHYDDQGPWDGLPVVLVHGHPFNRTLWGPVAKALAADAVCAWNFLDNASVATASGADHMVPRAEVEKLAKANYAHFLSGDQAPQSVSCPRGLRATMDDTVRCTAVFKGVRKTMAISVTGVNGDTVSFDYGQLKNGK